MQNQNRSTRYKRDSLSLAGAVAMGTGVMIGAGIFALTGQIAQLAGPWFPLAFLVAAIISGFSAYTYIKVSNRYPSAGGIAMILNKAYGPVAVTGGSALLMAFSMIINESLVARTFATYTLQLFPGDTPSILTPLLAIGLIIFAFAVNLAGNRFVGGLSKIAAVVKIGGILVFAVVALSAAGFSFEPATGGEPTQAGSVGGFLASVAIAILAYKGFTTITNSGSELKNPHRNVGRAIIIALVICLIVYMLVAWAVGSTLSIKEIIEVRDYSLAEAARPAVGDLGVQLTVALAIIATVSGVIASIFAVSRMIAMLTDMKLVPHRHFGMPGDIQKHTLVYTVVAAGVLAAFFDLGRIASMGAIFYLVMDIIIHWGVLRRMRKDVDANPVILISAITLDLIALAAFIWMKAIADPVIIAISLGGIVAIFLFESLFLRRVRTNQPEDGQEKPKAS